MFRIFLYIFSATILVFANYKSYGISIDGKLKYKKDFSHFEYTNPNAPKGGHLKKNSIGTFDTLNQFTIKGVPASSLELLYDTLMTSSLDEKLSNYPLIAKSIEIDKNKKWIKFHLNKKAHFSDNHKLRAEDVKFSFDILKSKGSPFYRKYYQDITKAIVINPLTIQFNISNPNNKELPIIIGHLPILPKHYWDKKDFSKTTLTPPIGSGAYVVDALRAGKYIRYKRNKNYWAKDLNVNKGMYNFGKITISYFRDENVAIEAFKAGEYDFRQEYRAKHWATMYKGRNFKNKNIIKEAIANSNPRGVQGFIFNTRKPIFQDIAVRKALNYVFDFEWLNKNLFFSQYTRTKSFFENSSLKATGEIKPKELKLLEPIRKHIPKEVFTKQYQTPTQSNRKEKRKNLLKAKDLLEQAGYVVKNKILINKKTKKPFIFEALVYSEGFLKVFLAFKKDLEVLGIKLKIKRVDVSQYINKIRNFDFDMIVSSYPQANWLGNEQMSYWHSKSANIKGSRNYIGIENKGIDILVEKIINSTNENEQQTIVRALDRVLKSHYFIIPHWYINKDRIAYWSKLKKPKILPKYIFTIDNWWIDEKVEKKINKSLNRQ